MLAQISCEITRLSQDDLYLFNEGSHLRLYEKLGAHPMRAAGVEDTYFPVGAGLLPAPTDFADPVAAPPMSHS